MLSFNIAQGAGGFSSGMSPSLPLPVRVVPGNQKFGPYTPLSSRSQTGAKSRCPSGSARLGTQTLEILGQGPPIEPEFQLSYDVYR